MAEASAARLQAIRVRYRWDKAWGVDDLLAMLDAQAADADLGRAIHRCFVVIDLTEPLEVAVAFVSEEWRAVLRSRDVGAVLETGYGENRTEALRALANRLEQSADADPARRGEEAGGC